MWRLRDDDDDDDAESDSDKAYMEERTHSDLSTIKTMALLYNLKKHYNFSKTP